MKRDKGLPTRLARAFYDFLMAETETQRIVAAWAAAHAYFMRHGTSSDRAALITHDLCQMRQISWADKRARITDRQIAKAVADAAKAVVGR